MKKIAIVCVNYNNAIGLKNKLLYKIPSELRLFQNKTTLNSNKNKKQNIMLMGRNTFNSMSNKPLKNRFNCVISTNADNLQNQFSYNNLNFFNNIDNCLNFIDTNRYKFNNLFICGGSSIYNYFIDNDLLDYIHYTKITNPENDFGDVFFPEIKNLKKFKRQEIVFYKDQKAINNFTKENLKINYQFEVYKNIFKQFMHNNKINDIENEKWIMDNYSDNNLEEKKYLDLLNEVLHYGEKRETRNSITISKFSSKLDFDISKSIPILTTKKIYTKGVIKELLWFINGNTNSKILERDNVNIWKGNSSREFLNSRRLPYEEGECGPIYGFQWRHFNADYITSTSNYENQGVDQLQNCIDLIKNNPKSRRIFMTAWNPCQLDEMCLPPCHVSYQFYVSNNNELSCCMYQRSGDLFLGIPFNIASTSILTYIIADLTGCKPGKISLVIGDAHIYDNHIDAVKKQLDRVPYSFPKLKIENNNYTKIEDYKYEDFKIIDYKYHPSIKADMIV